MTKFQILLLIDSIFVAIGLILILIGVLIYRSSHGSKIAEIDANCVEVKVEDYTYYNVDNQPRLIKDAKMPTYEYTYNGKAYRSTLSVRSNMPDFNPTVGPCKIRISKENPEKIYYPKGKFAPKLLIGLGAGFIIVILVVSAFLMLV